MWWKKAYEQLKREGYKFHNTDYDNRNKGLQLDYEIKSRPKIIDIIYLPISLYIRRLMYIVYI